MENEGKLSSAFYEASRMLIHKPACASIRVSGRGSRAAAGAWRGARGLECLRGGRRLSAPFSVSLRWVRRRRASAGLSPFSFPQAPGVGGNRELLQASRRRRRAGTSGLWARTGEAVARTGDGRRVACLAGPSPLRFPPSASRTGGGVILHILHPALPPNFNQT